MSDRTLWQLPVNQKAIIVGFSESLDSDYVLRLTELGFSMGEVVQCLRRIPFSGPRVYQVQSAIYALDQQLADGLYIGEIE